MGILLARARSRTGLANFGLRLSTPTVPSKTDIIISAEADIPYETLIAVMDAVRETSGSQKKLLFPDVVLGAP